MGWGGVDILGSPHVMRITTEPKSRSALGLLGRLVRWRTGVVVTTKHPLQPLPQHAHNFVLGRWVGVAAWCGGVWWRGVARWRGMALGW